MSEWCLGVTEKYERTFKICEKKQPNELIAVLRNLDVYFQALNELDNPLLIKAGFIHPEGQGIIAIDQKGGKQKVKLKQTRLYLFPDTEKRILNLLIVGDKQSQRLDIKYCKDFIAQIKKERS